MKQILFIAVGLMSLLGLSSCDDKSTFIEEEEFAPYGYYVRDAENIQVVGYKGLVIEEVGKSDWQLYVQHEMLFVGNETLKLEEYENPIILYDKNTLQVDIDTNMETIGEEEQIVSYAVGGLLLNYTYLGQQQQLICLTPLKVTLKLNVEETNENPFFEKGHVEFSLLANDTICIVQKSVPYTVASTDYYRNASETK